MIFLIADDHPMIREGVVAVLKQFDSAAVVLQASNADSAMSQVKSTPALDCVLLDLNMPGVSGVDTLAHMRDFAHAADLGVLVQ